MRKRNNDLAPKHFRGHVDYKSAFSAALSELTATNRASTIPRSERMALIGALTDEYVASTGERPAVTELERLADAVLYEELTDKSPDKMTREEYPILSDLQLSRRQSGVHQRKTSRQRGESSLNLASDYGTNGVEYRMPGRRKRTIEEQIWMDQAVLSRNEERRETYLKAAKPSRVISYRIGEEETNSDEVRKDLGFIIGV